MASPMRGSPAQAERGDAFLDRLDEAELRDEEEAVHLQQLQRAAEDDEMIRAAAAQIAAEQGLGPDEQRALEQTLAARLQQQAQQAQWEQQQAEAEAEAEAAEGGEEQGWGVGAPGGRGTAAYRSPLPPPPHRGILKRPGASPPGVASNPTTSMLPASASSDYSLAAGGHRSRGAPDQYIPSRARGLYAQPSDSGAAQGSAARYGDAAQRGAADEPRAAGGRSSNASAMVVRQGMVRHNRDPNQSSIAGGIFG